MTNRKINIIILTVFSFTILSCASFSKKRFRKEVSNLEKTELNKLTGNYSLNPIRRYLGKEKPNDRIPDSLKSNNGYYFLTNESYDKKIKFDSLKNIDNDYILSLNLENTNKIRVELVENSKIINDTLFSGKYKNGMFYLDNKYIDCNGVPFLFGGCRNNKRRIGLTKNGNLLINEAVSNEGALLLIIGTGYSYNVTYEYERK
ncbi:hypothetical protein [Aureibacter tunicatorum]|uniref:Lipoprotein n=1 Tax=Aureibacter tunicatorum TaxID=866807 RepID=A0AAE3XMP4_9BACT|nr:hypothetical protein [Aureibacter tunicatorum]MDR6238793.1 hypothetical protein [Aureibacter tunicatorum]BDD05278.1 hypothetical protein AUTU_27610 [Aureibacter tunicatorum]